MTWLSPHGQEAGSRAVLHLAIINHPRLLQGPAAPELRVVASVEGREARAPCATRVTLAPQRTAVKDGPALAPIVAPSPTPRARDLQPTVRGRSGRPTVHERIARADDGRSRM